MIEFGKAVRKTTPVRRGRILRNLKIDDVSSVDVGAGRGVRVVLAKRDGESRAKQEVTTMNDVDMETIRKVQAKVFDSVLDELMCDGKLSKRDAAAIIAGTRPAGPGDRDALAVLSESHRQEMAVRMAKLGLA